MRWKANEDGEGMVEDFGREVSDEVDDIYSMVV